MNYEALKDAKRIITAAMQAYRNPVIAFSGGKDSMVMLHIIAHHLRHHSLPILFHREPFQLHKYQFALSVLASWGLTAYDYPPAGRSMWLGKGILAFTNHYQVGTFANGAIATLDLPKNIERDDSSAAMCGKEHFVQAPTGRFAYPWDLVFHGQKNSDEDQIAGKTPLDCDIKQNVVGPSAAYPLRNWTDADVWSYAKTEAIPMDTYRYDVAEEKELSSKANNSDYFAACVRCIDKREGEVVICPKNGLEISNISAQVSYREPFHEHQMSTA